MARFTEKQQPELVHRMIWIRKGNREIVVEHRCGLDETDFVLSFIAVCFVIVPPKSHDVIIHWDLAFKNPGRIATNERSFDELRLASCYNPAARFPC